MRAMRTLVSSVTLALVLLALGGGAVQANPILEGYITSLTRVNNCCNVRAEFISQVGEFNLYLYRSKTLDGNGNVPALPANLVGSVDGDDAYNTTTVWDSLSNIWVTTYYYRLLDTNRSNGTWHYQLYCDYGDPGTLYPLWWTEDIALSGCSPYRCLARERVDIAMD